MHSIYSWSSAELCCSIFFWQCVRPYYCNRSQESLIHRGLSGKEKLLEQSPFLEPVVKSSDQSTLSPWASWGLGTWASVLQWPRCTEEKARKRQGEGVRGGDGQRGREKTRDVAIERERQPRSAGKKHHNSQTHKELAQHWCIHRAALQGWRDTGVGVDFSQHLHSLIHVTYVCLCHAGAFVSGWKSLHRGPFLWTKPPFKHHRQYDSRSEGPTEAQWRPSCSF